MDQWHVEVCYRSLYLFACLCPFNRWGWTQYVFGLSVCLWLCVSTYVHPCLGIGIPWSCHWLLLLKISFCKTTVANCHCVCCLQRIYVHKVLQCVDVCTDGWLHPRLPFWVSLATVAACSKRLRLDEVSGTRKSKQLATSTLHNIWIQFCSVSVHYLTPHFLCHHFPRICFFYYTRCSIVNFTLIATSLWQIMPLCAVPVDWLS